MNADTQPRAGRREWIGLAVLMLPTLLIAMDMTVLHLAVPSLTADLEPTSSQLLWITDIYGFMIAGSLITMGTLGDRIGRRKLLLMGAAAFGFASVLAAFSTSAGMLIASRAVLGVAGATLMPSTMSLIRNMFLDPRQRTVAIGIWVSGFSVGSAVGPLVVGLFFAASGAVLITQIGLNSLANVVIGNVIMSLGFGFTFTLTVDLVVGAAPPERAGAASALAETGAELGGALGLAVLGSLGMAIYRAEVTATMPQGIAPDLVEAVRETLGGAVAAASQLPDQLSTALLDAAHQSFVHGLQVNAFIGLVGFVGLSVLTATMLRHVQPHAETGEQAEPEPVERPVTMFAQPEPQIGD